MTVAEALLVAISGLSANRLRSGLTVLGIMIGVGAVVLLVAVGNGASVQVTNQIESLGSNLIYIYPASTRTAGVAQGFGSGQTLTMTDVQALTDHSQAPDIADAIPIANAPGLMTRGSQNWFAPVVASTQDFATVRNYQIQDGQFFSQSQVNSSARVVVIGQTVVDNLFGGSPQAALGQSIKIQRQPFTVIGTFVPKGSQGLGNQDNVAAVPITAAWNYLTGGRGKNISQVVVQATSASTITRATQEATQILLADHKISDPSQADFSTQSQQDILASYGQVTQTLTVLLGSIAAIALVVGGIGIMNIMLVTVTERTREIGIRKAIGARRSDILLQFLIESMFLSGIGGILGIVIGWGVALWLPRLNLSVLASLGRPVVSVPSALLAFGVSVGIGLFFGIYPANRAAALNPIEALRYE
ncbi:MAG TPA: ABC transporter permease [Candidatus Acidoferrales bacterium]|nr:ABC transporter permease [Candidatus Acidoferrales bacterium]